MTRRAKLEKCGVHQKVCDHCHKLLIEQHEVEYEDVLDDLGWGGLPFSAIEWGYVRDKLEEDFDELIPLSAWRFVHNATHCTQAPEKALAGGNGKTTAGLLLPDSSNPLHRALAARWYQQRSMVTDGAIRSRDGLKETLRKRGIEELEKKPAPLALE